MMFQWDQRFCIKRKVQCYEDAANEVAHTEANVYYYTEKNTIMLVKSFEFVKKKKKLNWSVVFVWERCLTWLQVSYSAQHCPHSF